MFCDGTQRILHVQLGMVRQWKNPIKINLLKMTGSPVFTHLNSDNLLTTIVENPVVNLKFECCSVQKMTNYQTVHGNNNKYKNNTRWKVCLNTKGQMKGI